MRIRLLLLLLLVVVVVVLLLLVLLVVVVLLMLGINDRVLVKVAQAGNGMLRDFALAAIVAARDGTRVVNGDGRPVQVRGH